MRICFVSATTIDGDPRALAAVHSTSMAGHDVIAVGATPSALPWVLSPSDPGLRDRISRRTVQDRVVAAAASQVADLYVPTHPKSVELATAAVSENGSGAVYVKPDWHPPASSLIWTAPGRPELAATGNKTVARSHVPGWDVGKLQERLGTVVVAYRRTDRNPGNYVENAFRRLGMSTIHTEVIDWDDIPVDTTAVVVVESPLPALPVRGDNPGVPVLFWVHHGEHHLDANIRLQRRYGAHGVALAHSWHLAYRYTGIVDRLPFGVAPEITERSFNPHATRQYEVGFVGSSEHGSRYSDRTEILDGLRQKMGADAVRVENHVTPKEMASLYRNSRMVLDHGWGQHLPITMRVFEATGAGATLATKAAPGLDLLFDQDAEFIAIDESPVDQIARVVTGGDHETVARTAHAKAWSEHTYDNRVQEFLSLADRVRDEKPERPSHEVEAEGLAGAANHFADAQRVVGLHAGPLIGLDDREVWDWDSGADRAEPGTFHIALIGGGKKSDRVRAIAAARLGVVVPNGLTSEVEPLVGDAHGQYELVNLGTVTALVFGKSGYRVSPNPDPVF